jgi:hypothetical protein
VKVAARFADKSTNCILGLAYIIEDTARVPLKAIPRTDGRVLIVGRKSLR